jgi:hypothetical protein
LEDAEAFEDHIYLKNNKIRTWKYPNDNDKSKMDPRGLLKLVNMLSKLDGMELTSPLTTQKGSKDNARILLNIDFGSKNKRQESLFMCSYLNTNANKTKYPFLLYQDAEEYQTLEESIFRRAEKFSNFEKILKLIGKDIALEPEEKDQIA